MPSAMLSLRTYLSLIKEQIIVTAQLTKGLWLLSKLSRSNHIVTIFGGTKLTQDTRYAQKAHDLAHMLADNNIPILTGGGPGIMQAANCGSKMGKGSGIFSMGIGVKGLETKNFCTQQYVRMTNFSARKALLMNYSAAFAVFPGGFGTLDELNGVITLMKTKKIQHSPILLFDTAFWKPFIVWLTDYALPNNLITESDIALITLVDSVEQAYTLLARTCAEKD